MSPAGTAQRAMAEMSSGSPPRARQRRREISTAANTPEGDHQAVGPQVEAARSRTRSRRGWGSTPGSSRRRSACISPPAGRRRRRTGRPWPAVTGDCRPLTAGSSCSAKKRAVTSLALAWRPRSSAEPSSMTALAASAWRAMTQPAGDEREHPQVGRGPGQRVARVLQAVAQEPARGVGQHGEGLGQVRRGSTPGPRRPSRAPGRARRSSRGSPRPRHRPASAACGRRGPWPGCRSCPRRSG